MFWNDIIFMEKNFMITKKMVIRSGFRSKSAVARLPVFPLRDKNKFFIKKFSAEEKTSFSCFFCKIQDDKGYFSYPTGPFRAECLDWPAYPKRRI